ncbi:DUF3857 domain-containing protein [Puia sp.]|uniref:DUF3857 domain-containing protein n=1 Tax=Puia sp. TaxID=2045100 RepID=UPI002F3E3E43
MKYPLGLLLALGLTFNPFSSTLFAQPPDRPGELFGAVVPETFAPVVYDLDSNANAIYFFDRGEVNFDASYTSSRVYTTIYERHTRLRIVNAGGLHLATMGLSLVHRSGYETSVEDIQGTVYNLEDGKVVATKLDKSGIFKDKSGHFVIDKIAFPNVKVGSIIEYSYRIVYPGFGFIPNWDFQGEYPVLWSQYEVTIPALYDYFVKSQGYRHFTVDTTMYSQTSFPVAFGVMRGTWEGPVLHRIWALEDATAMEKREPYTTTLQNHIQKVQFQLSSVRMDGYQKTYHSNWEQLTDELLKSENFGESLGDRAHWMDEQLSKVSPKGDVSPGAAQKLYAFVRDQYACTGQAGLGLSQPMKKTWAEKKGNVADINLLLAAVYRHQGFDASPVILSTREHGYPLDAFPMLSDYNYVITALRLNGTDYLLDATVNTNGFGQLPEPCYNGNAHAIDASHRVYPLLPDSVTEHRVTSLMLGNDENGGYSGTYRRTMGVFESMNERRRLKKTGPEEFFDNLRKTMGGSKQLLAHGFDSLSRLEEPLGWHYDMSFHFTQKTLYFYPVLHERISSNPLPGADRHYPVEMPFRVDNSYVMRMEIPRGYVVDQLPRSARFALEDGGGYYEYLLESDGKAINFRMRLQLNRTNYPVSDCKGLRDFYSLIVEKEKEQIIFKKSN